MLRKHWPTRLKTLALAVLILGNSSICLAQHDDWQQASLDDGRFKVKMPAKAFSTHFHNTSNKIYAEPNALFSLVAVRWAPESVEDASQDPIDFLHRYCNGVMKSWSGTEEIFEELKDPDYPAVEHRFRHGRLGAVSPGVFTSRAYYVGGQICSVFVDVKKENYEAQGDVVDAFQKRFFESLVIDRKRPPRSSFVDAVDDRSKWPAPDPKLRQRFAAAHGMLDRRFAFCQTMDIDEFHWIADELRTSGYRPITFRPYVAENVEKVAAAWARDGIAWVVASGQRPGQLEGANVRLGDAYSPVDVAGWELGKQIFYSGAWAKANGPRGTNEMIVGALSRELPKRTKPLSQAGYKSRRRHRFLGADGELRQSAIYHLPRQNASFRFVQGDRQFYEQELKKRLVPFDINLCLNQRGRILYLASLSNAKNEYAEAHGLSPADHLRRCEQIASSGMHPVAMTVTHVEGKGYLTASIWHKEAGEP